MNTQIKPRQKVEESTTPSRKPSVLIFLFALLIEAGVVYWIVSSEIPGKVFISNWSLMLPGVLALALFSLLFGILRIFMPRISGRDFMLLTYICIAVMGVLIGYGSLQLMLPSVAWMRISTNSPNFPKIMGMLPSWVAPTDPATLRAFQQGDSILNLGLLWYFVRAWMPTLIAWGGLSLTFAGVMISISVLMSRAWIREERLTFPIVMLPMEMSQARAPLFKNGLFWIGVAIPALLESLVALNYYFPSVPAVQLKHVEVALQYFPNRPWSAIYPLYVGFTPFIIGLGFLAPTDVAFSVFAFSLADRLAEVFASMMGWDLPSAGAAMNQMPYLRQQNVGAFIAFGAITLWRWTSRYRQRPHERWETIALGVAIIGSAAICVFFRLLGMDWWVAAVLIGMILMYAIALSRVRAESGVAWAFGSSGGANGNLAMLFGSATLSEQSRVALGISQWYSADMRFLPMAFQMESFKIADSAGWSRPRTALMIGAASLVGVVLGSLFIVIIMHTIGISTARLYPGTYWTAVGQANQTDTWLTAPTEYMGANVEWAGIGALITIALAFMRQRFLWWPLNPVGYVLAHTGTGWSFWVHYFVAWILKLIVLRYGGMKLYHKVLPFVYGIIAGDILTMTIWSVGAVLLHVPVYQFIS